MDIDRINKLVERAQARLAHLAGIRSVVFSVSLETETLGQPILLVYTTRDVGDLSEHARALGIRLETRLLEPVNAPSSALHTRGNPPLGGYRVQGPLKIGTFGSVGYLASNPEEMVFVSAAHVFATAPKTYSPDAWQPLKDDPINLIGNSALTELEAVDIIFYKIIPNSRNWVRSSEIFGLGPVTGVAQPKAKLKVTKVGQSTGQTSGRIIQYEPSEGWFIVEPEDKGQTLAAEGDSGALWVDEERRVVGVLLAGGKTNVVAATSVELLTRGGFHFYLPQQGFQART